MRPRIRVALTLFVGMGCYGAVPDRIPNRVDSSHTRVLPGTVHRLTSAQDDQGAVDPAMRMEYMKIVFKTSAAQQAELDTLLANQQNPSSPQFHKWLTPEQFGERFGLSAGDFAKVAAWLKSEGFTIDEQARGRNWIAFTGTAGQVSKSLRTSIHRYQVKGEKHLANADDVSIPDALADVVAGFSGLNDFYGRSMAVAAPLYNNGTSHALTPEDFSTIYNVAPLYQAGLDGTGVSIVVIGLSDVLLTDLQSFKTRFNLPANNPKAILYGGSDPGYNNAQGEGTLDLEWASAIAPKANITYVYGANYPAAMESAISNNYGQIISISYGGCEIPSNIAFFRAYGQQANAQGITIVAASGDSGAAGCDPHLAQPLANLGESVDFPAVLPEVTAVGGTRFNDTNGTYWATSNSPNSGSALSYIPEMALNDSTIVGLFSGGGGISRLYPRPAWQTGPGVPDDDFRHVPDVALNASGHVPYEFIYQGNLMGGRGTSFGAPSMAGIVALLNQAVVNSKAQSAPGLGNINPQLYRLAQSAPSVFHDIVDGNNIVPCAQGSPDCLAGSFGYNAGPGYDSATGLGSVDANTLVANWNTATNGVNVTLTASAAKLTTNETLQLTATVVSATGKGTPTGAVDFSAGSSFALGSASLDATGTASISIPAYLVNGTGTYLFVAEYSGDAAFSSGGGVTSIQITAPTGVAGILTTVPGTVYASVPDQQGLLWQTTLTVREVAGVAARITGFAIDGQSQPVGQYFPTADVRPNGSISTTFVLRNQATPLVHTFGFSGIDAAGQTWSQQKSVPYYGPTNTGGAILTATPLTVAQDTSADPSCQWPVQLHLDDVGGGNNGSFNLISALTDGPATLSSKIVPTFGNARLDARGSVSGTLCFGGLTPPIEKTLKVTLSNGFTQQVNVAFAGPPSKPVKLSAAPSSLVLPGDGSQATLNIGLSDPTQQWTVSVFPANRTTSWLGISQRSGTGPAQLVLTANGTGFEPGAYRATLVFQSVNAMPQTLSVPLMFVLGGSTAGTAISGVQEPVSGRATAVPGSMLYVVGTNLANTDNVGFKILPPSTSQYTNSGVGAYVNGLAAPVYSVSPTLLLIQVPYEAGSGPAALGVNNNGQVAGFQFQIAPSAPAIVADSTGNLLGQPPSQPGAVTSLLLTGAGDVSPSEMTGFAPLLTTPLTARPSPILPVSVTVGGVPAFIQSSGLQDGVLGIIQVNFIVPPTLTPGEYPVVVTVGGVSSAPVNVMVSGGAS